MAKKLIWQFEYSKPKLDSQLPVENQTPDDLKWEARYFWPTDTVIRIKGIDSALGKLENYQHKLKEDYYYLIPNHSFNIKLRREKLLYKPQVSQVNHIIAFGPKINLYDVSMHPQPYLEEIRQKVRTQGIEVLVKKESYTCKFLTQPSIKFELAKLEVQGILYFSCCVEGKSLHLVQTLSRQLLGKQKPSDYITFLKERLAHD